METLIPKGKAEQSGGADNPDDYKRSPDPHYSDKEGHKERSSYARDNEAAKRRDDGTHRPKK